MYLSILRWSVAKRALFIIFVICIVACTWLFERREKYGNAVMHDETKNFAEPPKKYYVIHHRSLKKRKRMLPAETTQKDQRQKSQYLDDAVLEIAIDDLSVLQKPDQMVSPVSAWHIEREKIKNLTVGDTLIVPLEGIEYPLQIVHRERMGKSTVMTAVYEDEGMRYPSVISIGKKTLFISFQTPSGGYQSSLLSSEGYVYSNSSIEAARVDSSKTDVLTVTSNRDLDIIPR